MSENRSVTLYVVGGCVALAAACGAAFFALRGNGSVENAKVTKSRIKRAPVSNPSPTKISSGKQNPRMLVKTVAVSDLDEELKKNGLTPKQIEEIKSKVGKNGKATVAFTIVAGDGKEKLSAENKIAMAKAVREQLEKAFQKMPKDQRERMRAKLNRPEGKKALNDSIKAYNTQLNGEQREAADPAFQAVLSKLNEIKEGK